jgi:hypothetical protein
MCAENCILEKDMMATKINEKERTQQVRQNHITLKDRKEISNFTVNRN